VSHDTPWGAAPSAGDVDPRIERTRSAIIEASFQLLIDDGPDVITHARVASVARVSRTTVYAHFPSRNDLLRATIEAFGKPFPAELTGDLHVDLAAMVADLVHDLADERRSRAIAAMIERSMHDPVVAQVRDDLVCDAFEQFRQAMSDAVERGEIADDVDVELAMAQLLGAFMFQRFMHGTPYAPDDVDRIVDDFIRRHSPRPER
jgi:AcrR family transcriptional regulator